MDPVTLALAKRYTDKEVETVDDRITTLTIEQQQDGEVIEARKGEVSLKAKMDSIDAQLAESVTNANNLGADPLLPDNTIPIQAALDEKGLVTITKPGIYNTGRLFIDDNTTFKLSDGVTLRRKDDTNHHLITNKGHVLGYRNKNITIDGGEFDFNISGQTVGGSGSLLENPQSWALIGILLHNIDNLKILNVAKIGNEAKYCYLICDIDGFEADNIRFDNTSDGLHFQPPMKNVRINNIKGYCEDDMISFTMGDYATYALGTYGDIENVEITNVTGEKKNDVYTDQLIKMVGSGLDGKSIFKNVKINNLSGGVIYYPVWIMGSDSNGEETGLKDTRIENVVIENINVELADPDTAYVRCGASGDLTIKNVRGKHTKYYFNFVGAKLSSINIDGVYNDDVVEVPLSPYIHVVTASGNIKKIILNNINLSLSTLSGIFIYISDGDVEETIVNNSFIDAQNQIFYAVEGIHSKPMNLRVNNSTVKCLTFVQPNNKVDVFTTNSLISPINYGAYLPDGADISIDSVNSIINNFKINTTNALKHLRLNGVGIDFKHNLSLLNSSRVGDIITSSGATESVLGVVAYGSDGWSKASFSPFKVTQNIVIGTLSAHTVVEKKYYITEYATDTNKMVTATPTFVLPEGLVYTVYNRDAMCIKLIVANVTASPIVVPDGDWVFNIK